jgi:flagellar basal-body rod modification protein FlgD
MADSTINATLINDLSIGTKIATDDTSTNELGSDVFLELLITQMENQNPLEPQDNSEFVAQLAQFTSVESLDSLNTSVESMAASFQSSQALQASALVGRQVTVETDTAYLSSGENISGSVSVDIVPDSLTRNIYSSSGQLVSTSVMTSTDVNSATVNGEMAFEWDGTDNDGDTMSDGTYRVEYLASYNGEAAQLTTHMSANVDSVSVGANGTMTLNLAGIGSASLSSVTEIL